jgi:hypothetical protein
MRLRKTVANAFVRNRPFTISALNACQSARFLARHPHSRKCFGRRKSDFYAKVFLAKSVAPAKETLFTPCRSQSEINYGKTSDFSREISFTEISPAFGLSKIGFKTSFNAPRIDIPCAAFYGTQLVSRKRRDGSAP